MELYNGMTQDADEESQIEGLPGVGKYGVIWGDLEKFEVGLFVEWLYIMPLQLSTACFIVEGVQCGTPSLSMKRHRGA